MTIGIDISQIAYENTGVSNFLKNLVTGLIKLDKKNNYVLFFSSLRKHFRPDFFSIEQLPRNVSVKEFKFPPTLLNILWNRLHIVPIEKLIGEIDIFITSDWTEPPTQRAKKATIVYDLLVYKYPQEMHNKTDINILKLLIKPNIVKAQKRKLKWVKKESDMIFCISESTKNDLREIFNIDKDKLRVIYPGLSI